jgi:hypothetical protein
MKAQATILLAIATALLPGAVWAQPAGNSPAGAPAPPQFTASQPSPKLSASAGDVVKLVTSGVPETVIKAYIDNSTTVFNLTTDNIIHLQGLGVSGALMADMLMHDKALKDNAAKYAATAWASQPPQPMAPAPMYPQPATTYAPPAPDYTTAYSPSVSYVGYDDYPAYPYYPAYYPWYGYSYFPSFVFGFGGRFGNHFDRDDRFGRFGGINAGRSFAGSRGGFSGGVSRPAVGGFGGIRSGGASIGGGRSGGAGGHR